MRVTKIFNPFLMMLLTALVVAVATVVEDARGTAYVHHYVYGTWWFRVLWFVVTVSAVCHITKKRLWRRPVLMGLHASFVIILTGALTTSITSVNGVLHLRKGIPQTHFISQAYGENAVTHKLPHPVRLDGFQIVYYPGTDAPSDYISDICIDHKPYTVSMNKVVSCDGYRLFQQSYDEDLEGSVLTVNYDPWGTPVTYLGYAILSLCACILSFPRFSGKRRMSLPLLLFFLTLSPSSFAAEKKAPLPVGKMEKGMQRMQVVWNGRRAPFGAMAHEFMLKVYGSADYHGIDATRVVSGMMLDPTRWSHEPIIKIKRGEYRPLTSYVNPEDGTLVGLGKDRKEDEKVALVVMLMQGTLFKPLPSDVTPLTPFQVEAELLYHRVDWTLWAVVLTAVVIAVGVCAKRRRRLAGVVTPLVSFLFCLLAFIWLLRWYISGHIPLSNGFETMVFVALCMQVAVLVRRRLLLAAETASLMLLVVAHMGVMNPHITPLMPVLHSPWLSAHVSVVMLSYALLVLSIVDRRLLRPAVCLLSVGIFLGAVWANVSWGTYWSWDPKESWALVTMLVYSVPLHTESLPWFRDIRHYRLYSLFALACLLMTYFGVNFLLGGMHSYAA